MKTTTVRLEDHVWEKLELVALANGTTVSEELRAAIDRHLESYATEELVKLVRARLDEQNAAFMRRAERLLDGAADDAEG